MDPGVDGMLLKLSLVMVSRSSFFVGASFYSMYAHLVPTFHLSLAHPFCVASISEFSYEIDGKRHFITPPPGNAHNEQFLTLAGDTEGKF